MKRGEAVIFTFNSVNLCVSKARVWRVATIPLRAEPRQRQKACRAKLEDWTTEEGLGDWNGLATAAVSKEVGG